MKKLMAGILAIAAVLSVTAPAQAEKTIKKPAEVEYDVSAELPDIVLKIALPSQMKAAINPYGNSFTLDELHTIQTQNGIVSVAYPVQNYDTEYGVFFDATAYTTTSSPKWNVTRDTLTAGVKGANMAVTAASTEAGIAEYSSEYKQATSATEQGNLPLDSTVTYDRKTGTTMGETSQKKFAYIPASADGTTPSEIFIGFAGKLAPDTSDVVINWTDSDYINVNLVLKVTPAAKTL